MSESKETKDKISLSKKSTKVSEETKEKLRKYKNASKKIYCVEDNKIFNSIVEASIYYNILHTSISNILTNRAKKINKINKSFKYLKDANINKI